MQIKQNKRQEKVFERMTVEHGGFAKKTLENPVLCIKKRKKERA